MAVRLPTFMRADRKNVCPEMLFWEEMPHGRIIWVAEGSTDMRFKAGRTWRMDVEKVEAVGGIHMAFLA